MIVGAKYIAEGRACLEMRSESDTRGRHSRAGLGREEAASVDATPPGSKVTYPPPLKRKRL
jgi:hypothetical protein